jgi:hypothetical protein
VLDRTVSTHEGWLRLFDYCGWPLAKVAATWGQPLAYVEEVLNELSMQPIPQRRQIPALPKTKAEAQERRDVIRLLYRQGPSLESLVQQFAYYSREVLERVVQQPLETEAGKAWAKRHIGRQQCPAVQAGQRLCSCGCMRPVHGKRKWARESCRKKA